MTVLRRSVASFSAFLGTGNGKIAAMVACAGSLALLPSAASALVIGPAGTIPVSDPTSVVDASVPGISYSLAPDTNLLPNGFDVRDLFGGSFGTNNYEQGDAVFTDGSARGAVDSVTISLTTPVSLGQFNLFMADDGPSGDRSASEFLLYSGTTLIDDIPILDNTGTQSYIGVYGSDSIEISDTLTNVPASSTYTLAFVQNEDAGPASGLRATEFIATPAAIAAPVPEPASLSLIAGGAFVLLGRRGRRSIAD